MGWDRLWDVLFPVLAMVGGLGAIVAVKVVIEWHRLRGEIKRFEIGGDGLTLETNAGKSGYMAWGDVVEVAIRVEEVGPVNEDVTYEILDTSGRLARIPRDLPNTGPLLERLQQFPDFDHDAVSNAMCTVSKSRFICWKRPKST